MKIDRLCCCLVDEFVAWNCGDADADNRFGRCGLCMLEMMSRSVFEVGLFGVAVYARKPILMCACDGHGSVDDCSMM